MCRKAPSLAAIVVDRLDYVITLARLTVLGWLAGPIPEPPALIDEAEFKRLCAAIGSVPSLALAEGPLALSPTDHHIDAPAPALAAN